MTLLPQMWEHVIHQNHARDDENISHSKLSTVGEIYDLRQLQQEVRGARPKGSPPASCCSSLTSACLTVADKSLTINNLYILMVEL